MPSPSQPQKLYDAIVAFSGGVNEGNSPLELPAATMAGAVNTTFRGGAPTHRSAYHKRSIGFASDAVQEAVETGYFQGACTYFSDDQETSLIAAISGRIFQFSINGNIVVCSEVTASSTVGPVQSQAWLWQAEKWVIIQDGLNPCRFFDGTTTTDSNYGTKTNFTTTLAGAFAGGSGIPALGTNGQITFTSVVNLLVNDVVTIPNGQFQVLAIVGAVVTLQNLNATPVGYNVGAGVTVAWAHTSGTQLPPGRMGTYGMGRVWMSLIDGKQFLAGDIVGGASGTVAEGNRDAVKYVTENLFLKGGGNFTVPGSVGDIQAMKFTANLDESLGQGPLQVFTHNTVFSCNAPVDRLTWQNLSNPILTESLIGNGGLGQNSTVLSNGDTFFRSIDGIRSLILARREFNTWGNTPISQEVRPRTITDDPGLLRFGSAIVFDNRLLMTVGTTHDTQGVYFKGIVPINFDPVSSIRGKAPSIWDSGVWTGINVLQLLVCEVDRVERAFAFVLNTGDNKIELWEILKSYDPNLPASAQPQSSIYDNNGIQNIPIIWSLDTPSMRFSVPEGDHKWMNLSNGEMWVADVQGTINFQTYYKPDQYPCWTLWHSWTECQSATSSASRPGYRPRMGFGSPPINAENCNSNGTPMSFGFTFQVRTVIQGHCVLYGEFFESTVQPMPGFAPMACDSICP